MGGGRRQKGHVNGALKKREGVWRGSTSSLLVNHAAQQIVNLQAGESQNYFSCPDPAFVNAWQHRTGAVVVVAYWFGEVPYTTNIHPPSFQPTKTPTSYFPSPSGRTEGYKGVSCPPFSQMKESDAENGKGRVSNSRTCHGSKSLAGRDTELAA